MAFDRSLLDPNSSGSSGLPTQAIYKDTDRTLAQLTTAGYFNSFYQGMTRICVMRIVASDGLADYKVTTNFEDRSVALSLYGTAGASPGSAGAACATIAALTALPSAPLVDGELRYVHAYDGGGYGGGWFRWHASSTAVTDGGVTFVPDDLTAAAAEETILYSQVTYSSGGSKALAHSGIVWGSVTFNYNDETQTLGDKWLHGHSVQPRHAANDPVFDKPLFSHAEGKIYRLGPRQIENLAETNTNTNATASLRSTKLNYRYTTGAGRWIREIGDYVTPAMFGGRPGVTSFDNSFFICWALNYLHYNDLAGSVALKYDGNYYVYGMWGEVYQDIHQIGLGGETPCVTYFGDQGSQSGGVIDLLKTEYLGEATTYLQSPYNGRDPYMLMFLNGAIQIQGSGSNAWRFTDFCVDGNIDNNLYFLTKKKLTDQPFTMAVASPGVITCNAHGLEASDTIVPSTDGALLTGLTAGSHYFVLSAGLTANTFRVALTREGTAINFTGTQSGSHTLTASDWSIEGVNGRVSQVLRESPTYGGFFITNQGGRAYGVGGVVFANNCTWGNMGGSPHAGAGGGIWKGSNLHFGKTISGRSAYGVQGQVTNLDTDGYTRSSSWAPYSGQFTNVRQRLNEENPWPENQSTMAFLGYRQETYIGEADDNSSYTATIKERYLGHGCEITNWTGTNDGGDLVSSIFNLSGTGFKLTNGKVDIGPLTGGTTIFNAASGPDGAISLSIHGFDYFNRSRSGMSLLSCAGSGYLEKASLNDVYVRDMQGSPFTVTIASPAVITATAHGLSAGSTFNPESTGELPTGMVKGKQYYVIATGLTADAFQFSLTLGGAAVNTTGTQSGSHLYFGGSRLVSDPEDLSVSVSAVMATFNMDPVPQEYIPPVRQQVVEFNNLRCDVMCEIMFNLEGGGNASGVPLDVHINGGYTTTRKNKLIKSVETDTTLSTKSRFFWTNHGLNLFDPGATNRGAADVTDPWIARSIMRGCYDRTTGRRSEIDIVKTITMVAGASVSITNASPAVVTDTAHGMSNGALVQFQGTLGSGLTAGELYYVVNKATDTYELSKVPGGASINTSGASSGVTRAKADTERLTTISNTNTYIDIPIDLMWKPMTYNAEPLSGAAIIAWPYSISVVYPKSVVGTSVDDNTKPRIRIGQDTFANGNVLTYRIEAAVAPSRSLAA